MFLLFDTSLSSHLFLQVIQLHLREMLAQAEKDTSEWNEDFFITNLASLAFFMASLAF
jgi:hypothetical protein